MFNMQLIDYKMNAQRVIYSWWVVATLVVPAPIGCWMLKLCFFFSTEMLYIVNSCLTKLNFDWQAQQPNGQLILTKDSFKSKL